jgi:hypothetical protein
MHATQPVIHSPRPVEPSRRVSRRRLPQKRTHPHSAIALETSVKLVINIILSTCATSALVQLYPLHHQVQEKLRNVEAEVQMTQERVNKAKTEFNRNFDPSQSRSLMQEYSNRVDPQKRQVIWKETPIKKLDKSSD